MARNNMTLMSLSGHDKAQLLRKLQGSPHFEKTLAASIASRVSSHGLTLPSWFVQQHGDKFRKLAFLRTEASTKVTWPVTLSVHVFTPNWIQVRFCGGWNAFITSNDLMVGDSLVFALVAMSEFEVYVFRKEGLPSQAQIRNDSKRSRKKTKQSLECRDRKQSVAGSSEGEEKVDGLNHKSKTVADENAASASRNHSPTPIRNESPENSTHQKVTRDRSLLPGFAKKLTATNVCHLDTKTSSMEIPQGFLRMYGSRIHSVVKLQGIHDQSPVRTMSCYTRSTITTSRGVKRMRTYLRTEWREFVNENHLHVGQELFFSLAADSFFVVREVQEPLS